MIDQVDHQAIEIACGTAAFAAGLGTAMRSARNWEHRWAFALGLSLLVAGLIDFTHGLIGTAIAPVAAPPDHLIPWTWSLSSFWLAVGFFRSGLALRGVRYAIPLRVAVVGEIALAGFALVSILTSELPDPYFEGWPHQPAAAAMGLAFGGIWWLYRRNRILSVALAIETASASSMCWSLQVFDGPSTLAHGLKFFGYMCVLIWAQLDSPMAKRSTAQGA